MIELMGYLTFHVVIYRMTNMKTKDAKISTADNDNEDAAPS